MDECLKTINAVQFHESSKYLPGQGRACPEKGGPARGRQVGSEEMVTINRLAEMIMEIVGKKLTIKHIPGPLGVRGRNSDNKLIKDKLGWAPGYSLRKGLEKTYPWVEGQIVRFS